MKKNILVLMVPFILLVYASCKPDQTTQMSNADNEHSSRNSLDWAGLYFGIVPCADCEGIKTIITLNKDQTYSLETKYLGKSGDAELMKGEFEWDKTGSKITLKNVDKNQRASMYRVGENTLTQLDLKGNTITGTLADKYILRKELTGILEKYWKLVELNGTPISMASDTQREAHMILKGQDQRVNGHSSCNSFGGTYELMNGNRIRFSKIAATKMACTDMTTESEFFKVFELADNYTLNGDTLFLNKARMAPLAKFHAVYLK
jgi:copper homeostasis protein (lipoprotein)